MKTWLNSAGLTAWRSLALFALYGSLLGASALAVWSCQVSTRPTGLLGVSPSQRGDAPELRVRLADGLDGVTIGGARTWRVSAGRNRAGRGEPRVVNGPVRVMVRDGAVRMIDVRGRVHGFASGVTVEVDPIDGVGSFEGRTYAGRFAVVPRGGQSPTRFDLLNLVDIELYVPGVLAQELYDGWPEQTYRAQAIAARSYALAERARARETGRWYDVNDDTRDQAYIGITDRQRALRAAQSTRGTVLVELDRIKKAYYSSTCGGRPALGAEIWPDQSSSNIRLVAERGEVSSERDHACQSAPLYRWQVVRSRSTLSARLRAWGRANDHARLAGFSTLHSVAPVKFSASGRPIAYEVVDVRGRRVVLDSERLRYACNASSGGAGRVSAKQRVMSNDMSFEVGSRAVTISGRGFGHGVGLCQYCAKGMAEHGDDAETMLRRFYPTAELRRAY